MAQNEVIYLSDRSVLVSTTDKLMQVKCPFKAICIVDIKHILTGDKITVWKVHSSEEHRLLYLIENKLYPYKHFHVIA